MPADPAAHGRDVPWCDPTATADNVKRTASEITFVWKQQACDVGDDTCESEDWFCERDVTAALRPIDEPQERVHQFQFGVHLLFGVSSAPVNIETVARAQVLVAARVLRYYTFLRLSARPDLSSGLSINSTLPVCLRSSSVIVIVRSIIYIRYIANRSFS